MWRRGKHDGENCWTKWHQKSTNLKNSQHVEGTNTYNQWFKIWAPIHTVWSASPIKMATRSYGHSHIQSVRLQHTDTCQASLSNQALGGPKGKRDVVWAQHLAFLTATRIAWPQQGPAIVMTCTACSCKAFLGSGMSCAHIRKVHTHMGTVQYHFWQVWMKFILVDLNKH